MGLYSGMGATKYETHWYRIILSYWMIILGHDKNQFFSHNSYVMTDRSDMNLNMSTLWFFLELTLTNTILYSLLLYFVWGSSQNPQSYAFPLFCHNCRWTFKKEW